MVKNQLLSEDQVGILLFYKDVEVIYSMEELMELANYDLTRPAFTETEVLNILDELLLADYLTEALAKKDGDKPFRITARGINALGTYYKTSFENHMIKAEDKRREKTEYEIRELELRIKKLEVNQLGFWHAKFLGLERFKWAVIFGGISGIIGFLL